jgi:hypothetical protein
MALRQQKPLIPRVLDHSAARLHQPLLQLVSDQFPILRGTTAALAAIMRGCRDSSLLMVFILRDQGVPGIVS